MIIRVYYDPQVGALFVDGLRGAFPARSLQAAQSGNTIIITYANLPAGDNFALLAVDFSWLYQQDGVTGFNNANDCLAYLQAEFACQTNVPAQLDRAQFAVTTDGPQSFTTNYPIAQVLTFSKNGIEQYDNDWSFSGSTFNVAPAAMVEAGDTLSVLYIVKG